MTTQTPSVTEAARQFSADLAQQWNLLPLLSPQDGDEWLAEFDELKQNEPRIGNGVWEFHLVPNLRITTPK